MVADVEGERLPRGQPSTHRPRRLRDISYLYISGRAPGPGSVATATRPVLRLGFIAHGHGAVKSEVCGNFAVQLARLGVRTLVLDVDPFLPNVGFVLGLAPQAYAAHWRAPEVRVERALLGLRVAEGIAGMEAVAGSAALQAEVASSDCILVNLPEADSGAEAVIERLRPLLGRERETTVAQAAPNSPMFGAWLATARRSPAPPASGPDQALDALVFVHAGANGAEVAAQFRALMPWLGPGRVHLLRWGNGGKAMQPQPWGWITPYAPLAQGRLPFSLVHPDHPAARTYEGLAQSLLATRGSRGGVYA